MSHSKHPRPAREAERGTRTAEGWHGWDAYARFYDWENRRTLGLRDAAFWRRLARTADAPVLELGCGTGRLSLPLARAGVTLVGIDRSAAMLARARRRAPRRLTLIRGDIRHLPFRDRRFAMVLAPYGVLQSLIRDADVTAALESVARVLKRGGVFGIDLVPDVPRWREYRNRTQLRGSAGGSRLTLIESVRQRRRSQVTVFDQRYVEQRAGRTREHRFQLTFRTLSVRQLTRRLTRAGFTIEATFGGYDGRPWSADAETWLMLARRT
jgi:ubiquinone/menaquinone biosynthesis C-methylase UbiE